MSKPALVCLLGIAAFFAATVSIVGPERKLRAQQQPHTDASNKAGSPKRKLGAFEGTGFEPGEFFTEEDAEHLQGALAYLDLTPKDLSFEKKHRNDRLRLRIADQALDQPLAVPKIAEQASSRFSARARVITATLQASQWLDLPPDRWTADELVKDGLKEVKRQAQYYEPAYTQASEAQQAAFKRRHDEELATELFGGIPRRLMRNPSSIDDEAVAVAVWAFGFTSLMNSLSRVPDTLAEQDAQVLAGLASQRVSDAVSIPGGITREGDFFELAGEVNLPAKLVAAARLAGNLEQHAAHRTRLVRMGSSANEGSPSTIPGVTGDVVEAWEGPWGKFVIGGTGPNTYEGDDFIGIIDLGGDDTYKGRVASAIGLPGHSPISFVLDLGGNDTYEGGDFTQGFGFLGVGMLIDLGKGNDRYSAGFCAQGAGICGVGILHDDGGNDTYTGDSFVQGAGMFGFGHLLNESGNDVYRACRYAQAFAQVKGVGVLTDGDGNDLYFAGGKYLHEPLFKDRYQSLSQGFAIGNRYDETGGGVALLLDEGDGNDVYQADIYGQGSSYWYSLGMLVDRGGNDTYTLGQYGQGAGIHLSAGILVDLKGNDTYTNPYGVGTGGAHDWSVGWLIDRAGHDLYQGNGQGQGLNFSVGILLDCAGDDSHISNNDNSVGKGVNNDISLLLDLAGDDHYGPKDVLDGQFTRRGRRAMVYDVPEDWSPDVDPSKLPTLQDPAPLTVDVQHILISWKDKSARVEPKDPERSQAAARELMLQVLKRARSKTGDWKQLQLDHNEDVRPHSTYTVEHDKRIFVQPFQDLALSLGTGQIAWCESEFGYHIIRRVR